MCPHEYCLLADHLPMCLLKEGLLQLGELINKKFWVFSVVIGVIYPFRGQLILTILGPHLACVLWCGDCIEICPRGADVIRHAFLSVL